MEVVSGRPTAARSRREPATLRGQPAGTELVLIGLGYQARVGKDSLARHLVAAHGFTQMAFADALRELAQKVDPNLRATLRAHGNDWEVAKRQDPAVRETLQEVGEAVRETLGRDVWVRALASRLAPVGRYVVSDVRHVEEALFIRDRGGLLVRVVRPRVGPANGHSSEHALDDWTDWDAVVHNDGTLAALAKAAAALAGVAGARE
ncbi:MAG TPA: hypothetical protein VNF75_01170 [Candidatus Dormibacteraeota bacterium]|nr:hypothetical protein [Candidatus Dormibacteraeota bacterium]